MRPTTCTKPEGVYCRLHNPAPKAASSLAEFMASKPGLPASMVLNGQALHKNFNLVTRLSGGYMPDAYQSVRNLDGLNTFYTKPTGGLWASTIGPDGRSGWDIFEGEDAAWYGPSEQVTFKPDARIVVVDGIRDYRHLLACYPWRPPVPAALRARAVEVNGDTPHNPHHVLQPDGQPRLTFDIERLAADYDGLLVTWRGVSEAGKGRDATANLGDGQMSLRMWDIESAIVLRQDAITVTPFVE